MSMETMDEAVARSWRLSELDDGVCQSGDVVEVLMMNGTCRIKALPQSSAEWVEVMLSPVEVSELAEILSGKDSPSQGPHR